jgi:hypothetical protein
MAASAITAAVTMAAMNAIIAVSAAPRRRKAHTKSRPFIHRDAININRLLAGVINNRLLKNRNGPINVNRLTCGLKRNADTETIFAAPISRC